MSVSVRGRGRYVLGYGSRSNGAGMRLAAAAGFLSIACPGLGAADPVVAQLASPAVMARTAPHFARTRRIAAMLDSPPRATAERLKRPARGLSPLLPGRQE